MELNPYLNVGYKKEINNKYVDNNGYVGYTPRVIKSSRIERVRREVERTRPVKLGGRFFIVQ